jgi:hypothetical protein
MITYTIDRWPLPFLDYLCWRPAGKVSQFKKAVKDMLLQRVLFEISLRMQFKAGKARRGTTNIGKIYSHPMQLLLLTLS